MYKLIALDMDGTLYNSEGKITPRTKQAIEAARRKGVKIVLASGRPLEGLIQPLTELNLVAPDEYVLCFNGGLVVNTHTHEIISKTTIKGKDFKQLGALAQELGINFFAFSATRGLICTKLGPYTRHEMELNGIEATFIKLDEVDDDEDIIKAMFCDPPEILAPALEKLPAWVTDNYTTLRSAPFFFEILNKGVDKGVGLQHLAEYLGITADEIIACGNEDNDYAMIKYAGLGVSMGNGINKLKAIANYIADTNDYDGVGKVIEKFVLK